MSNISYACLVYPYSVEQRVESSSEIYLGKVSGVRIPVYETESKKLPPIYNYEFRVAVSERIHGKEKKIIVFEAHWCGGGHAELGELVAVYFDKNGVPYISNGSAIHNLVRIAYNKKTHNNTLNKDATTVAPIS